jgi:hypothetical protein
VDNYYHTIRSVAAWIFWQQSQPEVPENWQLDPCFNYDRDCACHFESIGCDLNTKCIIPHFEMLMSKVPAISGLDTENTVRVCDLMHIV